MNVEQLIAMAHLPIFMSQMIAGSKVLTIAGTVRVKEESDRMRIGRQGWLGKLQETFFQKKGNEVWNAASQVFT